MVYHLAKSQWIHYSEGEGEGGGVGRKGREVGGKVGEGGPGVKIREALEEFKLRPERLANLLGLILSPGDSDSVCSQLWHLYLS